MLYSSHEISIATPLHRKIQLQTEHYEKNRDSTSCAAFDHSSLVAVMYKHLANVWQEIDHTNALLTQKEKKTRMEEYLVVLWGEGWGGRRGD